MASSYEQRAAVKFCFLLGKNAAETVAMIQTAYKDHALSKTQVYEWFSRFKKGEMVVEDQPCSGRPSTARSEDNIDKIRDLISEDRRRTIDQLENLSGLSWSSIQRILTIDLGMRRVAAKFVPKLLTGDQRDRRVQACLEMKDAFKDDPHFFNKIITGDESWCYGYDPESKQQSSQWKSPGSPRPKKARQVKSNVKTMLMCFFDIKGIVHSEFVPQNQTVNQQFYLEVMKWLRRSLSRKRPALWDSGVWFLHHDNAPAHTALSVRQFLASTKTTTLTHAPYSPDLAPSDFFLFPRMKRDLRGKRFADVEDVKRNVMKVLAGIKEDEFKRCFEHWNERLDKCINANGEYFEGD